MNYNLIFIIQIMIFTLSIVYLLIIYRIDRKNNINKPFKYIEINEDGNVKIKVLFFCVYMVIMIVFTFLNTRLFTSISESSNRNILAYTILPDYGIWMLISVFNSIYLSYFFSDLLLRIFLRGKYKYKVSSFNSINSSLLIVFCMVTILNFLSIFLIADATHWYASFDREKIIIGENFSFKTLAYDYSNVRKIHIYKVNKNESYSYYDLNVIFNDGYEWNSTPLRELNKTEILEIIDFLGKVTNQKIEINNSK